MARGQWNPQRLIQAREAMGWTRTDLAKRVGVTQPVVKRWETGKAQPRGEHLVALERVLGKPARWFYGEDEEPAPVEQVALPAMEEPTTPDWEPAPYADGAPGIAAVLAILAEHQRRLDVIERRLQEREGRGGASSAP